MPYSVPAVRGKNNNFNSIIYTIFDQFITNRANGGAINGTPAEPISNGNRVSIDTNNVMSITGGVLSIVNGGVGASNPEIWYAGINRTLGTILIVDVMTDIVSNVGQFGWDSDQSGGLQNCVQIGGTGIVVIANTGAPIVIGSKSNSTTYKFALILRSNGLWVFVKGGAFTTWTFLWTDSRGNTSSLFPSLGSNSGGTVVRYDNFKVSPTPYIPNPLCYDTFTRSNGSLGSSESIGPDGQSISPVSWGLQNGNIQILSNQASITSLNTGSAVAIVNLVSADILLDVALTRTTGSIGVQYRYQDVNNYCQAYVDAAGNCKLDKIVAGVLVNVINSAVTYGAGNVLKIICNGNSHQLFYNNAKVGATSTISDASLQSSTSLGVFGTDLSCLFDNFQIFPVGSNNEHIGLDQY